MEVPYLANEKITDRRRRVMEISVEHFPRWFSRIRLLFTSFRKMSEREHKYTCADPVETHQDRTHGRTNFIAGLQAPGLSTYDQKSRRQIRNPFQWRYRTYWSRFLHRS